ncbi:hypothetical protein BGY98DRAFT_968648 [Russula aff. rugulosa BPL654]|nr:hypothetical protein BGY98DRAFT_968648 [Russula aff. rugulosa BPL654]
MSKAYWRQIISPTNAYVYSVPMALAFIATRVNLMVSLRLAWFWLAGVIRVSSASTSARPYAELVCSVSQCVIWALCGDHRYSSRRNKARLRGLRSFFSPHYFPSITG